MSKEKCTSFFDHENLIAEFIVCSKKMLMSAIGFRLSCDGLKLCYRLLCGCMAKPTLFHYLTHQIMHYIILFRHQHADTLGKVGFIMFRRITALCMTVMLLAGFASMPVKAVFAAASLSEEKIRMKNVLTAATDHSDTDTVKIMVELEDEPVVFLHGDEKSSSRFSKLANEQKTAVKAAGKKLGREIVPLAQYYLLFNGFAFEGNYAEISALNMIDGITAFAAPEYAVPNMATSKELVYAPEAWDCGYTGKGTAVAIIDTGVTVGHEAFSVTPPEMKYTRVGMTQLINSYGMYMHCGNTAANLYASEKIPFAYDYYNDRYGSAHTGSTHGSHVAGIAAGNNGKTFRGVAYDAQIVAMQVFSSGGSASFVEILEAMEDCTYLGVEVLNMSLGAPFGSSDYYEDVQRKVYDRIAETGVMVAAAAGNETDSCESNALGGYTLTENPDNGIVGEPSSWPGSLSCASSDNHDGSSMVIITNGHEIPYTDVNSGTETAFSTLTGEHIYVSCGTGDENDFSGKDLTGKVAVIQRGINTFTDMCTRAKSHGAVGVIVKNNVEQSVNMSVETTIPIVMTPLECSSYFTSEGTFHTEKRQNAESVISSFSSRGPTTDLKLKPEITAPGGSILSVDGSGTTGYVTKSGTSMATPHVAGGIAVIRNYISRAFPELSARDQADLAYAYLMSTARPMKNELVREQGAGLMDLGSAVKAPCYLTTTENTRPKLEIGSSADGKFTLSFLVHNTSDEDVTYSVTTDVMTEKAVLRTINGKSVYTNSWTPDHVADKCDITGTSSVTIAPSHTEKVTVFLDMNEYTEELAELYPSGAYAEGFVFLKPQDRGTELSIPFLGFVGDWYYPSVIDTGYYWQKSIGEDYMWSNSSIAYNYAGSATYSSRGCGLNPYASGTQDNFSYDRTAVSAKNSDITRMQISLLRTARLVTVTHERENGEVIAELARQTDCIKCAKEYKIYSYTFGIAPDFSAVAEGEVTHIVMRAYLDVSGDFDPAVNKNAVWDIPVTVDNAAPVIENISYADGKLTLTAKDSHYIAQIRASQSASFTNSQSVLYYGEKGQDTVFEYESAAKLIYIQLADYAKNERTYTYVTQTGELIEGIIASDTKYEITFADSFTGEIISTDNVYDGAVISRFPDAPEHEGYLFAGWDYTGVPIKKDTTVNALYGHRVTLHDTLTGEDFFTAVTVHGQDFRLPAAPVHEGYDFAGWDGDGKNITKDTVICANYEIKVYDVICKDGLTGDIIMQSEVRHGEDIILPDAPIHDGYIFTGWSHDGKNIKEDLTITAQYKLPEYDLTFYVDGEIYRRLSLHEGEAIMPIPEPERTGHTFSGWSEMPDVMPDHDVDVYGSFSPKSYYVMFVDPIEGGIFAKQKVEYGKDAVLPDAPVHDGYTFTGWSHDGRNITRETIITARYAANVITLIFRDGVTGEDFAQLTFSYGEDVSIPAAPEHNGYRFTGWSADPANASEDGVIIANYEKITYTITFIDGYTGEVIAVITYEYGDEPELPTATEHEGLVFTGWDKPLNDPDAEMTVTALYDVRICEVVFVDGLNGNVISTEHVEYGKSASAPSAPVHYGYEFRYWDADLTQIKDDMRVLAIYGRFTGDVNDDGLINTADAVTVLKYAAGMIALTNEQLRTGDTSHDGIVNTADAVLMLKYAAGMIIRF